MKHTEAAARIEKNLEEGTMTLAQHDRALDRIDEIKADRNVHWSLKGKLYAIVSAPF